MIKLFKILSLFFTALFLFGALSTAFAYETKKFSSSIPAKSMVLMDSATGEILFSHNKDQMLPPASVTKIMTLLLTFEEIEKNNLKYDDVLTVSEYAASMGGSQVFLEPGEKMTVDELLKCVLIASANDAAVTLAEHIGGNEESFVKMMNEKAKSLGMKNTNFENTTGLDDDVTNHLTTAYDIALMSQALIKHSKVSEYATIWMDSIRNGTFTLTNTNRLVRYYNGITGLKTGSTDKAGFCISVTAKRDNLELIAVVMGADTSKDRNSLVSQILDFGFSNYEMYNNEGKDVEKIKVKCGVSEFVNAKYDTTNILENKGNKNKITYKVNTVESVTAPIMYGDKLGVVEYYLDGKLICESDIYATESIEKLSFWEYFLNLTKNLLNI